MFFRFQFLALYISPCTLSLCLPLLAPTLSYTIRLPMTYNNRCLLPLIKYLSYFTLCSQIHVMSKLGQLRTCFNLMKTGQNSCLSPLVELSNSIDYLHQSLLEVLKCEEFGFYIRLSSYYDCTCLQYCSDMLHSTARLASFRRFHTSTATATFVPAFILSRIDN